MLSKIRNRNRAGRKKDDAEEEEDSQNVVLLNRKVEIKDGSAEKEYTIGEFLGSGKFGDVNKCEEKATGYKLAAKFIPYSTRDEKEAVMNEVEIMNKLRHPRLIQLYDVFVQTDRITLIMELITGGELFQRVIDKNFELNEAMCEKFMRQILKGVEYIHSQHVIHLDLKPENILCMSRTGFQIKIIDFGLAREVTSGDMRVMFGTPEFVAPEIISFEPVSYATDMWSIGVVCYVLLSGLSPFMGDSENETLTNIVSCNYTFDYPEFNDISNDAKDFIKNLLNKNSKKRNTATQCLSHPWLKERPRIKRTATVSKKRLRHFVYRRKWQKAINIIIALLRMGVVLTPQPNKEHEYRKLFQAKSTKTQALLSKSSVRERQTNNTPDGNMKRNRSFATESELRKRSQRQEILQPLVVEKYKKSPQIMVTNPTKPDIKQPAQDSATKDRPPSSPGAEKPPTPKPSVTVATKSNSTQKTNPAPPKSEVKSTPQGVAIMTDQAKPTSKEPKVNDAKAKPEVSANKTPQGSGIRSNQWQIASDVTPNMKSQVSNSSPETKASVIGSSNKKETPESTVPNEQQPKPPPNKNQSPTSPKPPVSSPTKVDEKPPANAAPTKAASPAAVNNRPSKAPSTSTPGRSSVAGNQASALVKMVTLSRPRGSVADRINFFSSTPETSVKNAKPKKFSIYK